MTEGPPARNEVAPAEPPARSRRRIRALVVWAVLFTAAVAAFGVPTDPAYAFLWLWALTVAWRFDRPWRSHLAFARDWVPVVVLLTVYNVSRGFADELQAPHVTEMIHADEWMFGWATGGKIPTVWLQQHLYDPQHVAWWEAAVSWIYLSHFVAAFGAAIVLWLTARSRWAEFMRRWFALTMAGLITYFVYPAAPPWWAAQYGYLSDAVQRLSLRGGQEYGMHGAFKIVRLGQLASNPVAAMPSLHSAFALFVVAFFLPRTRRRFWPLLLAYPVAMTFTLVYSGEHYIVDVLVGWGYVAATFLGVRLFENRRRRRKAAAPMPERAVPTAETADVVVGDVR